MYFEPFKLKETAFNRYKLSRHARNNEEQHSTTEIKWKKIKNLSLVDLCS